MFLGYLSFAGMQGRLAFAVTVRRSPFTVHRSPFTVHRSPFAVRRSP
jgi:hypothetical protein